VSVYMCLCQCVCICVHVCFGLTVSVYVCLCPDDHDHLPPNETQTHQLLSGTYQQQLKKPETEMRSLMRLNGAKLTLELSSFTHYINTYDSGSHTSHVYVCVCMCM